MGDQIRNRKVKGQIHWEWKRKKSFSAYLRETLIAFSQTNTEVIIGLFCTYHQAETRNFCDIRLFLKIVFGEYLKNWAPLYILLGTQDILLYDCQKLGL